MGDGLKEYLAKRGGIPLDERLLESYSSEMNETVIPEIVRKIEQRELLAAQMRVSPSGTWRQKEKRN